MSTGTCCGSFTFKKGNERTHLWITPGEVSFYVSSLKPRNFPNYTSEAVFQPLRRSAFQPCVKTYNIFEVRVSPSFAARIVVLITTYALYCSHVETTLTLPFPSRNSDRPELARTSRHRLNTPNTYECRLTPVYLHVGDFNDFQPIGSLTSKTVRLFAIRLEDLIANPIDRRHPVVVSYVSARILQNIFSDALTRKIATYKPSTIEGERWNHRIRHGRTDISSNFHDSCHRDVL